MTRRLIYMSGYHCSDSVTASSSRRLHDSDELAATARRLKRVHK
ncbi:hypothetical protein CASFOL_028881 [Castilleja foliolosa]|uniref:Uncharacterized protein n=1 Tax=Castilleja foliolosa TaxID=1961234 RepID=A0ABD3CCG8_9LAMI